LDKTKTCWARTDFYFQVLGLYQTLEKIEHPIGNLRSAVSRRGARLLSISLGVRQRHGGRTDLKIRDEYEVSINDNV